MTPEEVERRIRTWTVPADIRVENMETIAERIRVGVDTTAFLTAWDQINETRKADASPSR